MPAIPAGLSENQASDDLDGIPLGTAAQERERAKSWMDTAAQHARNEAYWKKIADQEFDEIERWTEDFRACMAAVIDSEGGSPEHFVRKASKLADAMAAEWTERVERRKKAT